jgi:hypothetical protein
VPAGLAVIAKTVRDAKIINNTIVRITVFFTPSSFTPLEIMPRCSAAGLDFRIIPAGFNAPLEFLTGFTVC